MGVLEESEEGGVGADSYSSSLESLQVERLTTSLSLSSSSWMEVSCWGCCCRGPLKSRPRRSAASPSEKGSGRGGRV